MKATNKVYYLTAIALQGIALILEILPIGAVMVFATSPTEHTIEICSYFSLLPVGYANVTPMLTGILTVAIILFGAVGMTTASYTVSGAILLSICLQAVANRQE